LPIPAVLDLQSAHRATIYDSSSATSSMSELTAALFLDEDGIWRGHGSAAVSYPADGNDECFQIEDASFWFAHRNRCIAAAAGRFPPAGPIVDVGGGNGFVSRGLIDAGFGAIVLEPGPAGARNVVKLRA